MAGKGTKGRTQETKQDFLERTRREREAREVQRKREKAALDVQAFVRGRRVAQQRRSEERQGWDAEHQALSAAWAACPADSPTPSALLARAAALLRRLLFFYRPHLDADNSRLTALGLWILRGSGTGRKGQQLLSEMLARPPCAAAPKAGEAFLMARRVRALTMLSLRRLQRSATQAAQDVHALDCSVLITLKGLFAAHDALHRDFVDALLLHGLMQTVGAHLRRAVSARGKQAAVTPYAPAEENLQLLLITLTVNVLALTDEEGPSSHEMLSSGSPARHLPAGTASSHASESGAAGAAVGRPAAAELDAVEEFVRHVLVIRDLLHPGVLSAKGRLVLLGAAAVGGGAKDGGGEAGGAAGARKLWVAVLTALSRGNGALSHRLCVEEAEDAVAFVLGNLVELSIGCLQRSSALVRGLFAICVSGLLSHVRQAEHRRIEAGGDVEMEEEEDLQVESEHVQVAVETAAGITWVTQTKSRVLPSATAHLPPALAGVRQHVQALCSHKYVETLLDVVQTAPSEPGGAGAVASTCGLVMQILEFLPEDRTKVLNALAFKPAVLTMIWRTLVASLPRPSTAAGRAAGGQAAAAAAVAEAEAGSTEAVGADGADGALDLLQQESLFTMFCMVYEYFLMTADNDDLYTRQYPFELQQVRTMVDTLKRIIYPMYASRPGTHAPPPPAHAAAPGSGDTAMLDAPGAGLGGWAAASNKGCRVKLSESAKKLRTAGTKLLNRLYERNCHRAFMGDDEWLAPQWFVNAVESAMDESLAHRLVNPNDTVPLLADAHMLVLHRIPFALPFALRVRVFRHLIFQDRASVLDGPNEWVRARVRRARVLQDSYEELNVLGANLKRTVQIEFVNHEGLTEAGIDGGGLFKEFLNAFAGQAFSPEYGLFKSTEQALLFPNPQADSANPFAETINHLQLFEYIGRVIGKAVYDGILIELRLAPFFLRKMLGKEMYFDDLESLDEDLYKNLMWTKKYTGESGWESCYQQV